MQVIVDRSGKLLKNKKYKCDRADLRNNTRVGVLNMRSFFLPHGVYFRHVCLHAHRWLLLRCVGMLGNVLRKV